MSPGASRSHGSSISSFTVLVCLPTASAVAAWINWYGPYDPETRTSLVLTVIPFAGLLVALGHIVVTRIWSSLLAFLPLAIGAVAFAIDWWNVRSSCIADPDCNPIPVVMFFAGNLLPVFALAGGVASWINHKRTPPVRERLHPELPR